MVRDVFYFLSGGAKIWMTQLTQKLPRLAVFRNTLAAMWGYATRDANVMIRTT